MQVKDHVSYCSFMVTYNIIYYPFIDQWHIRCGNETIRVRGGGKPVQTPINQPLLGIRLTTISRSRSEHHRFMRDQYCLSEDSTKKIDSSINDSSLIQFYEGLIFSHPDVIAAVDNNCMPVRLYIVQIW